MSRTNWMRAVVIVVVVLIALVLVRLHGASGLVG
jgi:hypothetical protein